MSPKEAKAFWALQEKRELAARKAREMKHFVTHNVIDAHRFRLVA